MPQQDCSSGSGAAEIPLVSKRDFASFRFSPIDYFAILRANRRRIGDEEVTRSASGVVRIRDRWTWRSVSGSRHAAHVRLRSAMVLVQEPSHAILAT